MRLKLGMQLLGEANDEGGGEMNVQLGVTVETTPDV